MQYVLVYKGTVGVDGSNNALDSVDAQIAIAATTFSPPAPNAPIFKFIYAAKTQYGVQGFTPTLDPLGNIIDATRWLHFTVTIVGSAVRNPDGTYIPSNPETWSGTIDRVSGVTTDDATGLMLGYPVPAPQP